jgi:cytochrome c556
MKIAVLGSTLVLLAGALWTPACLRADDLDDALAALKQAEPSKDAAKVKELAAAAHATAKKYEGPAPADADKESYEARQRYAKDVDHYSEYALFALAVEKRSDPKLAMDLINTLERQNPKSDYLEMPDALEIQVDSAVGSKQTDRAIALANRMIADANKKPPEGTTAADWERIKGKGYYILGTTACERNKFAEADRDLRSALPLIKGNNGMLGPTLFCLGVVNYNLANLTNSKAKMLEAAKFSEQAAAIPGPTQDQAYKNSIAMKQAADRMR